MRQNPSFAMTDVTEMRRIIAAHPWATLIGHDADGMITASHYAVLLDEDRDDLTVVAHVGRPDDLLLGLGSGELTVVFQGPHGYITPRWYGDVPAVPTWNYTAVHLSGVPEILSDEENLVVLDRLVTHFEGWEPDPRGMWQAPNDEAYIDRLARGTVGFRLTPTRVTAKRKLSQNRPASVVDAIIAGLEGDGAYAQPALAAEMRRDAATRATAAARLTGA